MNDSLLDIRCSLLGALGLLAACGPVIEEPVGSGAGGSIGDGPSTATADDGSGEPPPVACEGATPILQRGVEGSIPTGWEQCANAVIHRAQIVTCENPLPSGASCTLEDQNCSTDADCTDRPHGRCIQYSDVFIDEEYCGCSYGCATDDDCGDEWLCMCGAEQSGYPSYSRCVRKTCDEDASCGGTMCALATANDGCGLSYRAACLTPDDECNNYDQCDGEDCFPQDDGHWACEDFCCCGRPLLVQGCPVTAPVIGRDDWMEGGTTEQAANAAAERSAPPSMSSLPPAVARRIAAHWAEAGQLEHASVASFARFTLELMGQGAPPQLLAQAQRAGLDEIDHARRCFALASAHAGRPVGPGPLPVAGLEAADTLEAVMAAVIDEACIGETLAAVEARAALAHATCPAVRATLEVIAADELRHAALGWATLRWALDQVDAALGQRLWQRLADAITRAEAARPVAMVDHDRTWLRAYGVLDPADRRHAHTEAIEQVLRPCLDALRLHGSTVSARA
ncbi:MAG: ferritin-like domain-containing protein [Myxococcota bacterium]